MGSVSKRNSASRRQFKVWPRSGSDIVNDEGEKIGHIGSLGRIYLKGTMPDTLLEAMVGRRLSEVIVRHDLCRDVRITGADNLSDHWYIETAGHPVLPASIAEKRKRETA